MNIDNGSLAHTSLNCKYIICTKMQENSFLRRKALRDRFSNEKPKVKTMDSCCRKNHRTVRWLKRLFDEQNNTLVCKVMINTYNVEICLANRGLANATELQALQRILIGFLRVRTTAIWSKLRVIACYVHFSDTSFF